MGVPMIKDDTIDNRAIIVQKNTIEQQTTMNNMITNIMNIWNRHSKEFTFRESIMICLGLSNITKYEHCYNLIVQRSRNLLAGCGCCKRHAFGLYDKNFQHVLNYNTEIPTTYTLDGKPCDCKCRMIARCLL